MRDEREAVVAGGDHQRSDQEPEAGRSQSLTSARGRTAIGSRPSASGRGVTATPISARGDGSRGE